MAELLMISIGVGLAISLAFSELFGVAAGGMIVPGYVALFLHRPMLIVWTLVAALLTYLVVEGLSQVTILYGRRLTAVTILVGYLMGLGVRWIVESKLFVDNNLLTGADWAGGPGWMAVAGWEETAVIGFIIPGLIAIWYQRQGVVDTTISLLTAAAAVRLFLIAVLGHLVAL